MPAFTAPFWARRVLNESSVLHHWDKPFEGAELWYAPCGLSVRIPAYYGPWPTDSGDKCEQCEALLEMESGGAG